MTSVTRNLLYGLAALALFMALPQAASAQTTLTAILIGTDDDPDAFGLARFRERGRRVVLEVEVQDVTFSGDVVVALDGVVIAEIVLTCGRGVIELEVEHIGTGLYYQPPVGNPIPIQAGSEIDILDIDSGTLLLAGVFG
jgi:hypothetical protein